MRLDRVTLQGFLSHEATDWAPDSARLVTLVGANGAGKSSLAVDALLYCLFDDARGRTDDLVRLGSTDMAVTVEFTYAGGRYRVTRGRTTRSGGKSFLEFAIADGDTWRPLTAESIRETQALVEQLLRMDAATFETAVVLVQGESMRFAEATPADRKRILGQVLGLDLWERAELRAKDAAREVAGRCDGVRLQLERIESRVGELDEAPGLVTRWLGELTAINGAQALAMTHRDEAEATLRDLAGRVATAEAAVAEVTRLEAEVEAQKGRWQRANQAKAQAETAITRAAAALERAPEVEVAAARLPDLTAKVAAAERVETTLRGRERELADWQGRQRVAERDQQQKTSAWQQERGAIEARVRQLTSSLERLEPVTCPKCRHAFPADPAGLALDLKLAEQALRDFRAEPTLSSELMRAENQARLVEEKIRELAFDAPALASLRADLGATERTAAAAGEIAAARVALEDARRSLASSREELDAVTVAGRAAREALTAARERAEAVTGLLAQRDLQQAVVAGARDALVALDRQRDGARDQLATAQAQAAERGRLTAEAESVRAGIEADEVELRRLRRLTDAFGVKGIPARIIASVLPELEGYANELLADLRPGMTLAVRAERARKGKDGVVDALDLVVRDDAGERPLAMFSGGERMSVALAIAVALSRLVARRAGTAIRSLIVDEPDGLDADARRSFGQALRVLAHHGELERVVLVSHHADLADVGDAVYQVTKNGHGSVVEQVA